jgi:TfoX/Sxy family transcriptional regulator of competence genes
MPKPSEADKERFRSIFGSFPGVEIKPMFGNLGAFVNGNMFSGLFGSTLGLRLSEPDREDFARNSELMPFGPAERPMAEYVGLPVQAPPDKIEFWAGKALAFVSNLPPKAPKVSKNKD